MPSARLRGAFRIAFWSLLAFPLALPARPQNKTAGDCQADCEAQVQKGCAECCKGEKDPAFCIAGCALSGTVDDPQPACPNVKCSANCRPPSKRKAPCAPSRVCSSLAGSADLISKCVEWLQRCEHDLGTVCNFRGFAKKVREDLMEPCEEAKGNVCGEIEGWCDSRYPEDSSRSECKGVLYKASEECKCCPTGSSGEHLDGAIRNEAARFDDKTLNELRRSHAPDTLKHAPSVGNAEGNAQ